MPPETALAALQALANPERARGMAAYHKVARPYLGIPNPLVAELATSWRHGLDIEARINLAAGLWQTNIFEARLAAAKLLTQARIRPDDAAWALIVDWVPQFDCWALSDAVCSAGGRRLTASPERLDTVALWTTSDHMWSRRAALVMTLPWTRQNHPTDRDLGIRERILGWAAGYVDDRDWFIQKAVAWWLRDLSRHDPARTCAFLREHGDRMKPFARKEAARHLPKD